MFKASENIKTTSTTKQSLFFSKKIVYAVKTEDDFSEEDDLALFQKKSLNFTNNKKPEISRQWQYFCDYLNKWDGSKSEKLMLLKSAFNCLTNPIEQGDLALFISAAKHLKSASGMQLFHSLFAADIAIEQRHLHYYSTVCQLLVDLSDSPGLVKIVKKTLPDLKLLIDNLEDLQFEYLAAKYPERNIDETIARFAEKNASVQYPLAKEELDIVKTQYLQIKDHLQSLKSLSQTALQEKLAKLVNSGEDSETIKVQMLAIIAETIRRFYKIAAYDTQILSLLSLINSPSEKLKGRLAQIKTGEGKSTIIAMLTAFKAVQGNFVDVVTSSPYLAKRDCKKYSPFYEALGLSASHICKEQPTKEDFKGQIIYGTNVDFEFAMLRDGLYNMNLRHSLRHGKLQTRTYDVVIIDEVDNLFLDTALNSARMAINTRENIVWIYEMILSFVKDPINCNLNKSEMIKELRNYLLAKTDTALHAQIQSFDDQRLGHWLTNAYVAWYEKKENHHYLVRKSHRSTDAGLEENNEIVIIDYAHTGRLNEGSQWQQGLHQFLQVKHHAKVTSESLTSASLAHSTYFTLYKECFGLTGTMGEKSEREEIQKIYHIDTVDIPPHFPSQRKKLASQILPTRKEKFQQIAKAIEIAQKEGRPVLILFKTVEESNDFSQFLAECGIKHQLLNETQREAEDFIVARAGEAAVITVATNTAGRGTDITLSAQSRAAGGLHMIFAFYPDTIRDEEQGFGRAGRQNDPGSCCMILDDNDETFRDLLDKQDCDSSINISHNPIRFLLEHALRADNTKFSADEVIFFLDQLRSQKIQLDSERRFQCSQAEAIYFEKMNEFFVQLDAVNQQFQQQEFKEFFINECQQFVADNGQHNGLPTDWSNFFEQFKHNYLSNLRLQWALFYNQLHTNNNLTNVQNHVDKIYLQAKPEIDKYLLNPKENIIVCLKDLLVSLKGVDNSDEPDNGIKISI